MLKQVLIAVGVAALSLSLYGCGGTTTKTVVEQKETQGQQLLDLQEAYDKGVITESEFKRTKNEILKGG